MNMTHETIAARLAESVQRKKHLAEVITKAESKYQEPINELQAEIDELKAKQANLKKKERDEFAELDKQEKDYRIKLGDAPIGANWATEFGKVTIQGRDAPKVFNFAKIPLQFRKDPEQCVKVPDIKRALKRGESVPGFRLEQVPTVVVR